MADSRETWADREEEPVARQGNKMEPVHPERAIRKEDMNRIRGMQQIKDETGPTNHTSNPSG